MAAISMHLYTRPYQVSTSPDRTLPHRKWHHLGTKHAVSHRSAAFLADAEGSIVREWNDPVGVVYEFSSGSFVKVTL